MKTLHVVGYKNSGKTTLLARWVQLVKKEGLSVAVLKHHGHSEPLTLPKDSTDSSQFAIAGADISAVAGGGTAQVLLNEEPSFTEMVAIVSSGKPDILFIEGYKGEMSEKVVLLRNEEDWETLQRLEGIQLIVGSGKFESIFPQIESREAIHELDEWLLKWIGERR